MSGFYTPDSFLYDDDEDKIQKDTLKKNLIEKIIKKIKEDGREKEFGLEVESKFRPEETKRKSASLFGDDDSDDNSDDKPYSKKSASLFGNDYDSDDDVDIH